MVKKDKERDRPRIGIRDYKSDLREFDTIDWPGLDSKQVKVMKLRCNEIQEAHLAAREWFKKKNQIIDEFSATEFNAEEQVQQVYRMLIDPESCNPDYRVFKTVDEARKELTVEERNFFIDCHVSMMVKAIEAWGLDDNE